MKNTKFFVSTLIAAAAMTATAYSEGEVISLNFTHGNTGKITENAGGEAGLVPVGYAGWVNISSAGDTTLGTGETVSTTYASGTWQSKTDNPSTVGELLLKGYIDIPNYTVTNWKVGVSNISYLTYDVYAYFAGDTDGDNIVFASISVNGQSYTGDGETGSVAVSNPTGWGSLDNKATSLQLGVNALKVSDVVGSNVVLTSDWVSDSKRATLAGIQIVNTYKGTATNVDLGGNPIDWTDTVIGSKDWTSSTAESGTYAAFNLTSDTIVNVTGENIVTDAITASGTGTLTLSGNGITLIGPGVIRSESDSSISVNNDLVFTNGGSVSGNVAVGGNVSVTGGVLYADSSVLGNFTGAVSIAEEGTLNLGDLTAAKTDVSAITGTGKIIFNAQPSDHSAGIKLGSGFTGTLQVSGNANLPRDTELGGATKVVLKNVYVWSGETATYSQAFEVVGSATNIGDVGLNKQRGPNSSITYEGSFTLTEGSSFSFEQGSTTFKGNFDGASGKIYVAGGNLTFSGESSQIGELDFRGGTITVSGGTLSVSDMVKFVFSEGAKLTVTEGATLDLGTVGGKYIRKGITGAGTVKVASNLGGHSGAVVLDDDFSGTLDFSGKLEVGNIGNLGSEATVELSKYETHTYSSLWGSGELNCKILFKTDYQVGDSLGQETTFNGTVEGKEGTVVTTGGTGAGNVVNFKGTSTFDTLKIHSGETNFFGEANIKKLNISGGTLNVNDEGVLTIDNGVSGDTGGAASLLGEGKITVNAGGTAKFAGHDLMGWSSNDNIVATLEGSSDKKATLMVNDNQSMTFTSGIEMKGNAWISTENSSSIDTYGGKIIATGTNNLVSDVEIRLRKTFDVEVTGLNDELEISGCIADVGSSAGERQLTMNKTGLGTLTLSGTNTFSESVINVNAGTLIAASTTALGKGRVSVAEDATLKLNVAVNGVGTVALAEGAKFAIDVTGLNPTLMSANGNESVALSILSTSALTFNGANASTLSSNDIDVCFDSTTSNLGAWSEWQREWSYDGTTLNLTLTIPEPSAFGLLAGVGALALVVSRRRRVKKA